MLTDFDLLLVSQAVGFGVFLWLGLYVLSRAAYRTPIVVATLVGLFSQAAFFLSDHLVTIATDKIFHNLITRLFWWDNIVPMAVWFHLSSLISRERFLKRTGPIFTPLVTISYTAALILSLLGTFTNFILDNDGTIVTNSTFYTGAGGGFFYYILYLAIVGLAALFNLTSTFLRKRRERRPNERIFTIQLGLLAAGAVMFLAGGLWLACRLYWRWAISELPGDLFVILGLLVLGYAIANYDLLLEGQNGQRDFIYSFTGVILINLLYAIVLAIFGLNQIYSLLIVGLVTLSHSMVDFGRQILDKLFFSKAEQEARSDARAYALALASTPTATLTLPVNGAELPEPLPEPIAPPLDNIQRDASSLEPPQIPLNIANSTLLPFQSNSQKEFNDLVRRAITGLKNPTQMVKNPLLSLKIVTQRLALNGVEDNRLNRAAILRELLIEQIEGLRPTDNEASINRTAESWRFYNVLHYPYVREISRKGALTEARRLAEERRRNGQRDIGQFEQVLNWLVDVDEDTFYKWQRRASDTVASVLWEQEFREAAPIFQSEAAPIGRPS